MRSKERFVGKRSLGGGKIKGGYHAVVYGLAVLGTMGLGGCVSRYRVADADDHEQTFRDIVQSYQLETARLVTASPAATPQAMTSIDPQADRLFSGGALHQGARAVPVGLEDLFLRAIQHSSQINVFSDLPLIRETAIQEAAGIFDIRFFADARHTDRNDPIGSTLISREETTLLEQETKISVGVRKKMTPGTEIYLTQELNRTRNNAEFLTPNPQAGARLVLGVVQPLLNGAGIRYNTSVMQVAALDTEIARNEYVRQAEAHLLEIARAYWALSTARGIYQAKKTSYEDAAEVLRELESRGDFDAVRQQILRARAVTAERQADLIRAESALRNGADRLKALVNDPDYRGDTDLELIPSDIPFTEELAVNLADAAQFALENRPEIQQAYLQLEAASVRRRMSRNELLPTLNVFAEAYLAGLAFDRMDDAWEDQNDDSDPSYMFGVRLEFPLGNNQARAQNTRRRLEMRQIISQLETTMETVLLDVKFSVREVETAYRDLVAKYQSMQAAREDLENLKSRRDATFLGRDANAVAYLNLLLDTQERQVMAEERYLLALGTYNTALVTLQRAQGTLLAYESLEAEQTRERDEDRRLGESRRLPAYRLVPAEAELEVE